MKKNSWRRFGRIVFKTVLFILIFVTLIFIAVHTPPVQNYLSKRIVSYLEKKLNTRVEIGKIRVVLPQKIVLENIYLEDQLKDTLISGGTIRAKLSLFKLFRNEVEVKNLQLQNVTAKVKRLLPDTTFNFKFIVDAFTSEKNKETDTAESPPLKLAVENLSFENLNIIYRDILTGDDMTVHVGMLYAKIDTLDPYTSNYSIPVLQVSNLIARLYQVKPLAEAETVAEDIVEAARPSPFHIKFGKAELNNIDIDYGNTVSSFFTKLKIGNLRAVSKTIDLQNRVLHLNGLKIDNTVSATRLGKKEQARIVAKEIEKEVQVQARYDWDIRIDTIDFNNNSFAFDNDNKPKQSHGIDYAHMRGDSLTLHINKFVLNSDSISGLITKASFREQSGFQLDELQSDFLYASNKTFVKDLYLKTPGTEIKRYVLLNYTSYKALADTFDRTYLDADIANSYVQVKDILAFAPKLRSRPAFANPQAIWHINFQGNGTLQSLYIENLQFEGLKNTRIDAKGSLAVATDPNRTGAALTIRKLHTTQTDIALFTGMRLSTEQINIPEEFDANGTLAGTINNLSANLNIYSSAGAASINGRFTNLSNPASATYTAVVKTNSLNLGNILRNDQLGHVNANLAISGKGLKPGSLDTKFKGAIYSLGYNDYVYRNINLDGILRQSSFIINTNINDPNIHVNGIASGNISANPSFRFKGMVDSLKALPLHFATRPLVFRGEVDADIPVINADYLEANVLITKALLVSGEQRLPLDTIQFVAGRSDTGQFIYFTSDVANARINGQYRYSDLGRIIQNSIQPYFSVSPGNTKSTIKPYNFTFTLDIANAPVLTAFVPGLTSFEPIHAEGSLVTGQGLNATMSTPFIFYNGNEINGLNLKINTTASGLQFIADVDRLKGKGHNIYHTQFTGTALNNRIDFALNIDDSRAVDKYHFSGILTQPSRGNYVISLHPDSLILNYEKWTISPGNSLTITKDNILASNFTLQKNDQRLSLDGSGEQLHVNFSNFHIATITGILKSDSLLVNGSMTGKMVFKNLLKQPVFTSDLTINDLSFKGDTLGNAIVKVDNISGNRYNTNATVTGRGNDISLTGSFAPQGESDVALDLDLVIRQVQLATIEGAFGGFLKNASGSVYGTVSIGGTLNQPTISGPINFDKASFALSILGSQFRIDQEKLTVTENGFHFDDFLIKDTSNNVLRLNGNIQTPNFINYYFDLDINATNFKILQTTKKDNKIYYGDLVITSELHVDGTEENPIIDGNITVNDGTDMTIVIPQQEPGVIEREGIVEFVNMAAPENDSLFRAYDSLNVSGIVGMDIATNIEIKKEAIFNVIIDEANGDFMSLQGEGQITTGIDPSGKITMVGNYELEKGAYEITFNFLHRRFEIQKGSRLVWLNEPTRATMDVSAVYIAKTAPIDLVQNQIAESTPAIRNTYLQKLPFEIRLHLTGELLHPEVAFDIVLPTDKNYGVSNDIITQVGSRLEQLRQDPGEIQKQAFALLLLGRFVGQNPLESSSPTFSPANYLRQSVSKLLTGQLNKLASGLIDGVDLNFDVIASDDYTTGEKRSRTDLNIGLSKRLLNERVTITVGSNFELQGPKKGNQKASNVLGNLSVNYAISRDGSYAIRFFRKNEYEGILDGYIIETGLSFLISVDYDRFREILRRKKNQRVEGVGE